MEEMRTNGFEGGSAFQIEPGVFQQDKSRFRFMVEALPQIIWTMNTDGRVTYCNQIWYDSTGTARTTCPLEPNWLRCIHPEDQLPVLKAQQQAVRSGKSGEIELRLWQQQQKDYDWFLLRVLPIRDEQGGVLAWMGVCTNIQDQKQAEKRLSVYDSLAQSILDAIVVTNLKGQIVNWNQAAETLFGWRSEEVQGKILGQVLHVSYPEGTREAWLQKILALNYWQGSTRQQRKDGSWLDIQTGISVLKDKHGQALGLVEIMRDITVSAQLGRELREREQQLQAALELAKLGDWKLYLKSGKIECSARSKAHFGYPADADMTLEMIIDRILPEDRDLNLKEALDYKEEYHGEYRVLWPDGSLHWIALSGQGQYGPQSGKPFAVVGVTLDITERKLEEQRKDSFIGMAGHELKTPLTSLKGFAQLLARQLRRFELNDQIALLERMDSQINAMTTMVNELMDVSQIQAEKLEYTWKMVDIDRLVTKVITALQPTSVGHTIILHGATHTRIRGDQARLEQVLTHLIANAVKYSPQTTQVDVSLETSGDHVIIQVRDWGIGIPADERERIFNRFYRADTAWRRAISGMGMGLYIAREIVTKHGGTISVVSQEGAGSTFTVELPIKRLE